VEIVYNAMDAFILPSKMEGTPISILEAMASGTTIFAANVGAIGEIVQDNSNGYFLTMNLEEDVKLINQHWNNNDIKEAARNYVDTMHNVENNAIDFFNILLSDDDYFCQNIESSINLKLPGEYI
jgi:glycosyltransferase involved in cell wall biosynthesis